MSRTDCVCWTCDHCGAKEIHFIGKRGDRYFLPNGWTKTPQAEQPERKHQCPMCSNTVMPWVVTERDEPGDGN
jgi:ribosomal protein L37AE/L43A